MKYTTLHACLTGLTAAQIAKANGIFAQANAVAAKEKDDLDQADIALDFGYEYLSFGVTTNPSSDFPDLTDLHLSGEHVVIAEFVTLVQQVVDALGTSLYANWAEHTDYHGVNEYGGGAMLLRAGLPPCIVRSPTYEDMTKSRTINFVNEYGRAGQPPYGSPTYEAAKASASHCKFVQSVKKRRLLPGSPRVEHVLHLGDDEVLNILALHETILPGPAPRIGDRVVVYHHHKQYGIIKPEYNALFYRIAYVTPRLGSAVYRVSLRRDIIRSALYALRKVCGMVACWAGSHKLISWSEERMKQHPHILGGVFTPQQCGRPGCSFHTSIFEITPP